MFFGYRQIQRYKVCKHKLIIISDYDHLERVIDLRTVNRYNSFNSNLLTLFTDSRETANINANDIKNFKEIFACIKQNLDTINSGKYYAEETTSAGTALIFVDPAKVRVKK